MISKKEVGHKIALARSALGLSQAELSKRMGYKSPSSIAKIELGENDITLDTLQRLCDILGLDPSYILKEEEEPLTPYGVSSLQEVRFKRRNKVFSFRVGGVIKEDEKILIIKKGDSYTTPLGNLKIGEDALSGVKRIYKNTLGLNIEVGNLLATIEYDKKDDEEDYNTFYLIFEVYPKKKKTLIKPEGKVAKGVFLSLSALKNLDIKPSGVKEAMLNNGPSPIFIHKQSS